MADKVSNDIKSRLRSAGVKPFKYAKDIGKALLFDSLPNTFSESLPAFNSVYQTSSDAAYSISSFARGGASQLKGSVGKMLNTSDSTSSMFKTAQNLISDLKTGKLYDKNRDRDDDFFGSSNDSLLDNFGGVDLNYTDDGEYIESGNNDYLGAQKDIAEAESKAADARMKTVVASIGTSAEAQMKAAQGMTQASMQLSAKMHDESMNMQKNQLAISSAIYETMNKRLSEMQVMLQEANKSLVTDVSESKSSLKVIEKAYAPKKDMFGSSGGPNPFLGGTLDLREYVKVIKGNIENSPLGIITSMLPMLGMMSGMDSRKKNNPILYLTDFIANALVPKKTKQRMARSNATLEGFFPSLLAKLAEKGEGFGAGSMLASIFGFKEQDIKTINTAKYLKSQTVWTGKDSKALTDVIPTQLAQIISILNGQPMRLFNYDTGKFENAYRAAGNAQASVNNVMMSGEVTNLLNARVNALKFRSNDEKQAFMRYVQEFFNSAVTKGNNINPYSKNFRSGLSGLHGNDRFADILTGLLQTMDKSEMIRFGAEIQQSRASRTSNRNYVNSDLVSSGMIMAFANVGLEGVDEKDQDRLLTAVINRANNSTRPISVNDIKQIMHRTKSMSNKRKSSVIDVLNDVRNILRRGVISYSYLVSGGPAGEAVTPPGFDDALKDARAARRTMKQRKQGTTGRERTIGGVTDTERNRLLREVARRGNTMSQQRLEEIAEKLGYANTQELKQKAQEYYSGSVQLSGNRTVDVTGGKIDPRMIGNMLRGTDINQDTLSDMIDELGSDRLNETFKKGKSSMQRFRDRITGVTDKLRSPFKLVDYALDFVDSALFKILYGDIPEDLKNKKDQEQSVQSIITASITAQTEKFGNFLNDKFDFVDEKLFGKEGLFNKFKNWAKSKLLGEQDEDGNYVGGKFSDQANAIRSKVKEKGGDVYAAMKDAILGSRSGKLVRKKTRDGKYRMVRAYEGGLLQPLRDKFEEFKEYLFGPEGEMTESRKLGQEVAGELKKAAPSMGKGALAGAGITAGAGLLTGLFLPGGPLTGAIIGSAMGLVKSSDKLKKYLFGDVDENGERKGGIISKKVYDGAKKYGKNILGGAGIGATLGNLGLLPFGMGNMVGAVMGAMGGMVKGSDKLRTMFFGSDDDPNSGVIPANARKKIKSMLPGWLIGKTTGTMLWNVISNLGLIPGLSLLPGGPILGAIGGLVGAFSKDNLEAFFFGKKDEDGKRDDSGVFSKMFNGFKDRVIQPIADKINEMGEGIEGWFHEVVEKNLADFFAPMKELFKRGMNKAKKKAQDITDMLRGAITSVVKEKLGGPLGRLMNLIFGEKDEKGHRKRGIVNATKWLVSKPFQVLGAAGRMMSRGIERSDNRFERKEQRRYNRQMKKDRRAGTAWQDEMGNWHLADEEGFYAAQDERRERRGMGAGFWEKAEEFRSKGAESREKKQAEREARRKARDKKNREKMAEENEEVKAQSVAVEDGMKKSGVAPGIDIIGTNTARTNDFLAAILAQLGGDPSDIQSTTMGESFGSEGAEGGYGTTTVGTTNILGKSFNLGKRLLRKVGASMAPNIPLLGTAEDNDPKNKKGKYLKDLYQRADRAITAARDPRRAADEIIDQIPEEYAEEGIEIVNRVYDLNIGHGQKKIGGSDGGDTGLWETLMGIGGYAMDAVSQLAQMLMQMLGGNMPYNTRYGNQYGNQSYNTNTGTYTSGGGGTGTTIFTTGGGSSTLALPSGQQVLQIGSPGNPGNLSFTQMLKNGWKTGGFGGLINSVKGYVTSKGGISKTIASGLKTAATAAAKNPGKTGKAALIAAAVTAGLSGLGQLTSGEDNGFFGNAVSGLKTVGGTAANMIPTVASGLLSSENIMRSLSGQSLSLSRQGGKFALTKGASNGILAGIGSLTPTQIQQVWKNGALDVADMATDQATHAAQNVGVNSLNKLKGLYTKASSAASGFAEGASKTVSNLSASAADTTLGKNLTKVATAIKQKVVEAATKFFNSSAVKTILGAFGKKASKIPQAIGSALDKYLLSALKNAAAKIGATASQYAAKAAATVGTGGLALIAFAIADFMGGMGNANKYFKVAEADDTLGMKICSGIVNCLVGLLSNLMASTGLGIVGSIALSMFFPTGTVAQLLYKLIVGEDAEAELAEKQAKLQEECDQYNAENGTSYTVDEYSEKVDSNSFTKTVKNVANTLVSGAKSVGSAVGGAVTKAASWVSEKLGGSSSSDNTGSTSLSDIAQSVNKAVSIITGLKIVKESLGGNTSAIQTAASTAVSNLKNTMTAEALSELSSKLKTNNLESSITSNFMNGYSSASTILNINGSSLTVPMRIAAGAGKALSDMTNGAIDAAEFAGTLASQLTTTNEANKAKNDAKTATSSSKASQAAKTMSLSNRSTVSSSDTVAADTTQEKSFGEKIGEAASNAWNTVKSTASNVLNGIKSFFGFGRGPWGRGEYFSQTDPKWNQYDPTMKDAGCGPTVAAMMASHYGKGRWGRAANPAEADAMSKSMAGMRDPDGGTNPAFFEAYGASKGLNMQEGPANRNAIAQSLSSGNAVGLMGEGGPFGNNMHYMMADGIDSSGNVHIVDPYGGQQSTQSLNSLTRNTSTAIYSQNLAPDGLPYEEGSPDPSLTGKGRWGRRWGRASTVTTTKRTTRPTRTTTRSGANYSKNTSKAREVAAPIPNNNKYRANSSPTGRGKRVRFGKGPSNLTDIQQAIVNVANNWRSYSGIRASAGYCESWVEDVYYYAGVDIGNSELQGCRYKFTSAKAARNATRVSTDWSKIPVGACVYSGDGYDATRSHNYGHVGIYIGNGQVASCVGGNGNDAPVHVQSLSEWRAGPSWNFYGDTTGGGWGWMGVNVPGAVADDGSTVSATGTTDSSNTAQCDNFIAIAKAEIGYKEKASNSQLDDKEANAGSGNYTKYGRDVSGQTGPGWPWCHQFVSWCAKKAGCENIIPITASCAEGVSYFRNKNQYHEKSGYTPKKGDIIYFGSGGGDHVGIVTDCDGSYVYTVEGNTGSQGSSSVVAEGNAVCDKKYPLDTARIHGYGSPAYSGGVSGSSSESGSEYGGIFGAFQQAFDQIQSKFDEIFAPFTGSTSSSDSSSDSTGTSTGTVGSSGSDSGGTLTGGSSFPKYTGLTDQQKKFIAGVASAEQDSSDLSAQRLEVSQMANLNEVEYKKGTTGSDLVSTLKGGWYAQNSLNKANAGKYSDKSLQAVEEVLVQGKRTLPRHVTEHDFYGDITNIDLNPSTDTGKQNRRNMKPGDRIKNSMGSSYQFYKFAGVKGAEGSGDPFGSKDQYVKSPYTEDVPWGSGRGRSRNNPSSHNIYNTGGIQRSVNQAVYGMGAAKQNAEVERKIDAIDTQTRAISKAAKSGEFGKGTNDTAIQLIADNMVKVVELLTDIRDQTVSANSAASTSGKGKNKYASQNTRKSSDPGTVSMKQMALRS